MRLHGQLVEVDLQLDDLAWLADFKSNAFGPLLESHDQKFRTYLWVKLLHPSISLVAWGFKRACQFICDLRRPLSIITSSRTKTFPMS